MGQRPCLALLSCEIGQIAAECSSRERKWYEIYDPDGQAISSPYFLVCCSAALTPPNPTSMVHLLQARGKQAVLLSIDGGTLGFAEALRGQDGVCGQFHHAPSQSEPVLYSSLCTTLKRPLYLDLDLLKAVEKKEWISYMNSFQYSDGLFRDPILENELADTVGWRGWRNLTLHALMALGSWTESICILGSTLGYG